MAGTSIEQLQLSVRASNVLHRLGIHNIEELIKTPLEDIAQQRNIGAKTLDEIKHILENADHIIEHAAELADNSLKVILRLHSRKNNCLRCPDIQ